MRGRPTPVLVHGPAMLDRFREELPRLPLSYFEEPAPEFPHLLPCRGASLRLSDAYSDEARRAEKEGWRVAHRPAHHLAVITEPQELSAAIEELVDGLAR